MNLRHPGAHTLASCRLKLGSLSGTDSYFLVCISASEAPDLRFLQCAKQEPSLTSSLDGSGTFEKHLGLLRKPPSALRLWPRSPPAIFSSSPGRSSSLLRYLYWPVLVPLPLQPTLCSIVFRDHSPCLNRLPLPLSPPLPPTQLLF